LQLCINLDLRRQFGIGQVLGGIFFYATAQFGDVFHMQGEAGGVFMTAEFDQKVFALLEGIVDIECPSDVCPGWFYIDGEWVAPSPPEEN
jgi:hypothetical protein